MDNNVLATAHRAAALGTLHIGHIDENLGHAEIEDDHGHLFGEIYRREDQSLVCALPELAREVIRLKEIIEVRTESWLNTTEALDLRKDALQELTQKLAIAVEALKTIEDRHCKNCADEALLALHRIAKIAKPKEA